MRRKRIESEQVRKRRATIERRIQEMRAMAKDYSMAELVDQRQELAAAIAVWRREISVLNAENLADGSRVGLSPDDAMLARRVERKARIARLQVDCTDAEERLQPLDAKIAAIEADNAERAYRDAIGNLKIAATPSAWTQLRESGLTLIRHRRLSTSSALLLMKISRLSNVGAPQAVRLRNERVDDFLLWLPKKKEAA